MALPSRASRHPFGLTRLTYWLIAVLVIVLVGAIPLAGTALATIAIVAAVVCWFISPARVKGEIYEPVPLQRREEMPLYRLEVVGESYYQAEISQAVALGGRALTAALRWTPGNKHSPTRSAIRVDLIVGERVFTCGHIAEQEAPKFVDVIATAADAGTLAVVPAAVFGGTADKPHFGVFLGSGVTPPRDRDPARGPRFE